MIFNSIQFFVFLIITFIIYYIVKDKYKYIILLIASYYFYCSSNPKNIIVLLLVTLISYISGLIVDKSSGTKNKKRTIAITTILLVGLLLYFKYSCFIIQNINTILSENFSIENIVVPLGISFFTLQAISYPIDIYRKDVQVEKNILKYSLFISFFPQILSGPIGKAKEMLPQFSRKHLFNKKNIFNGIMIIIYGLFKKVVVADLMAIGINNVYGNLSEFKGIPLLITVIMYSLQIYFDFSSYSNIAYGCAKIFGYELNKNFNLPYFASSVKEFWSRWHMSLSTWFRDYLYFPLGGNRCKKYKCYLNILIVFLVSGLWHGAAWTYIVWGGIHAIYQILERMFNLKFNNKILNIIKTFILITFAWIFFRSNTINDAIYVITNMFNISFAGIKEQILSIGLDKYDLIVLFVSVISILVIEVLQYKKQIYNKFKNLQLIPKLIICIILIFITVIFGSYGPGFDNSQFIYLGY